MNNATDVAKYFTHMPGKALHKYPMDEWLYHAQIFNFARVPGRPRAEAWYQLDGGEYSYRPASGTVRKAGVIKAALAHYSRLVAGVKFNACLANLYEDGSDSVAWHSDDEPDMGPAVVSVSYGATRRFSVRCKRTRQVTDFDLGHADVLIMATGAQDHFEHCIRKTKKPVGPRLSLTFRELLK